MVNIEIVYVLADKTLIQRYGVLPNGASVQDALKQCGLWEEYPEVQQLNLGIFSKKVTLNTLLREGDRLEVYRPLISCPKEKRRQRAKR